MIPALAEYIAALRELGGVFTELANDSRDIEESADRVRNEEREDKAEWLFRGLRERSNALHGNLSECVHVFDSVDGDFKAIQAFQAVEKEFSAEVLRECQAIVADNMTPTNNNRVIKGSITEALKMITS